MVGDPEDVMIDDNEVAGDGAVLVLHVLLHALLVVHRHRQASRMPNAEEEKDRHRRRQPGRSSPPARRHRRQRLRRSKKIRQLV